MKQLVLYIPFTVLLPVSLSLSCVLFVSHLTHSQGVRARHGPQGCATLQAWSSGLLRFWPPCYYSGMALGAAAGAVPISVNVWLGLAVHFPSLYRCVASTQTG